VCVPVIYGADAELLVELGFPKGIRPLNAVEDRSRGGQRVGDRCELGSVNLRVGCCRFTYDAVSTCVEFCLSVGPDE
jgi:hypothetical protein